MSHNRCANGKERGWSSWLFLNWHNGFVGLQSRLKRNHW